MYLIVLPDEMRIGCKISDFQVGCLVAELDYEGIATDMFPNEARSWTKYGRLDLMQLLVNHGVSGGNPLDYKGLIELCKELADSIPADQRSLKALEAKAGPRPLAGDIRAIIPARFDQPVSEACKGAPPSIKHSPPKLPGETRAAPTKGATGRVHQIADDLFAQDASQTHNIKEFRKRVIEACEAEGLNPGTAATQFGKWKAGKGL